MQSPVFSTWLLAGSLLASVLPSVANAANYNLLYNFAGPPDGAEPFGALVRDTAGNFYGTASSGGKSNGVVYKLAKPAAGSTAWTERVIYTFRGGALDGAEPAAPLAIDSNGTLYGTTLGGGIGHSGGTIFRLVPPKSGNTNWTETILYRFSGKKGTNSVGGLVIGKDGALYGTACSCGLGAVGKGAVFRLMPPTSGTGVWTYQDIHLFTGGADGGLPHAGLTAGPDGTLYGTTSAGGATTSFGTVFSLTSRTGKSWTETVLWSFTGGADGAYPRAGVALDAKGNVYTTVEVGGSGNPGSGTVVQLTPPSQPGGKWSEHTIYTFKGGADGGQPGSTPVVGSDGTVFATTDYGGDIHSTNCEQIEQPPGCGVVFALMPPAAGKTAWQEKVLHAFDGTHGFTPWSGLYLDATGLYGNTALGGTSDNGTVFQVEP